MNIKIGKGGDFEVVLAFKDDSSISLDIYKYLVEKELFKATNGEVYSNLSPDGKHLIILGLGEKEKVSAESLRKAFFKLGRTLINLKVENLSVSIPVFENLCYKETIMAVTEGILQSEYSFEKYLTEKKIIPCVKDFYLIPAEGKEEVAKDASLEAINIVEGIFLTRDLVNERAFVLTPKKLAEAAKAELEPLGVKVEVLGKSEIEKHDMKAFLAVSQGSINEPQFIKMTWNGGSGEKIALVGKGITYDSGGYSIKPSTSMDTMHSDMGGAGSVIGAMKAIAKNKLEKNVVGIVAACENLISGDAYKPGDIIGSMKGTTIEVVNTDAEGRLTLADALWYAATVVKADKIIDLATLTGACIVALSDVATGAVTNNEDLMRDIVQASKRAGEHIWHLPHFKEFDKRVLSDKADLINTSKGPMGAGTITAGLFLGHFVKDIPWVHLDIAGTAYLDTPRTYLPKGASGIPVSTIYNYIKCN